jgi:predicted nuclease of predicted toxin-antitoxin system
MKLLLDEMYPSSVAEQLRERGHDVLSLHEPRHCGPEGAPDEEVWRCAISERRALVSENVGDFRRIEAHALANGEPVAQLIFTSDRQFPRGNPRTTGRLVHALDALLHAPPERSTATFLRAATRADS